MNSQTEPLKAIPINFLFHIPKFHTLRYLNKHNTAHDLKCADSLRLHFVDGSDVQYSGSLLDIAKLDFALAAIVSKRE